MRLVVRKDGGGGGVDVRGELPGSLVDTAKEWGGWGFNMAKEAGKKAVTEGKKVKHTLSVRPKFHCRILRRSLIT